ncbi:MAG TPA: NAD-binding protein, partial [Pseudomonadales bacterium]|nr:NAD-binding protein [Pseudomonadales bacterium]
AAVERARPALQRLGTKLVHTGPPGSATRMKLARNMLNFAAFAAGLEAARLAEAAGLDLMALGEVVRHSDGVSGGPGSILLRPTTAPLEPDDPWFAILDATWGLGDKDLGFALDLASELGVDVPLGTLARQVLRANMGLPPSVDSGASS